MAAQHDREQLVKAMDKSVDVQKELHSRIADRQAASLRADLLGQKAAPVTQMWLQEMENLDEQLATLPGDSLIAACLVVYGGPMHASERQDAVEVWRECVGKSGLSVCSTPFRLDAFLWRRQNQVSRCLHQVLPFQLPTLSSTAHGRHERTFRSCPEVVRLDRVFVSSISCSPPSSHH